MNESLYTQLHTETVPLTTEMISNCTYCTMISPDPQYRTPVSCTKYSGSCCPIYVNLATCLTCGEYKKSCAPKPLEEVHPC